MAVDLPSEIEIASVRLYRELTPWYRLLDPPEEHADEAAAYARALSRPRVGKAETLLELGSGAGGNAVHLKKHFRTTLSDLSPEMLALSRALNPECEHRQGDFRSLRLGRTFDAVLLHDAVMYMTTEADLSAAIETAYVHTRAGGVALVAPDCTTESFEESAELFLKDEAGRSMRCMAWSWDPDPHDTSFRTEYSFLLREGAEMKAVHDTHVEGLFSQETWKRLLGGAGFEVELTQRPIDEDTFDEVFVCHRL